MAGQAAGVLEFRAQGVWDQLFVLPSICVSSKRLSSGREELVGGCPGSARCPGRRLGWEAAWGRRTPE